MSKCWELECLLRRNKSKVRISKRVFQENKARQIFRKINIYPLKCSFFGKFDVLCFLETPVLRFALLPYYRRLMASALSSYRPGLSRYSKKCLPPYMKSLNAIVVNLKNPTLFKNGENSLFGKENEMLVF